MECLAIGRPEPSIHWVSPPTRKIVNRFRRPPNTQTLVIDDIRSRDAGEYRCLAGNRDGQAQAKLSLHVYDPHAHLTCQSIGSDHVTVTWTDVESTTSGVIYVITHRLLTHSAATPNSGKQVRGQFVLRSRMRSWRIGDLLRSSDYELCLGFLKTGNGDLIQINCTKVTTNDVSGVMTWADGLSDFFVFLTTTFCCVFTLGFTVVIATACRRYARRRCHSAAADEEEEEDAEGEDESGGHLANEADDRGRRTEMPSYFVVGGNLLTREWHRPIDIREEKEEEEEEREKEEEEGGYKDVSRVASTLQLIATTSSSSCSSTSSSSCSDFPPSSVSSSLSSSSSFHHSSFSCVV